MILSKEFKNKLERCNQQHILEAFDKLDDEVQQKIVNYLDLFDLERHISICKKLTEESIATPCTALRPEKVKWTGPSTWTGSDKVLIIESKESPEIMKEWERRGEQWLSEGKLAVVLLAGGQGTRLGWTGPKGTFAVGGVSGHTLYQLHSEKILALRNKHKASVPFYIMTSAHTHGPTVQHFVDNLFFGLPENDVFFFEQREIPPLTKGDLELLLDPETGIARSPEGNGGVYESLREAGVLADLAKRGVEAVHVVGVDNALQQILPAAMIGAMLHSSADVATHWCRRSNVNEKVGCLCVNKEGRAQVIEYSDFPADLAQRQERDGSLYFEMGSICSHVYTLNFLEKLSGLGSILNHHMAIKKVPYLSVEDGRLITPDSVNAIKLELFIFDSFPHAARLLAVEAVRDECFSPVKNASGEDSPDSARAMMDKLYRTWLKAAGVAVTGEGLVEISPVRSLHGENLKGLPAVTAPAFLK